MSDFRTYLDLPRPGADGSIGGGIHPELPLSVETLCDALEAVRAAGIEPTRYAALLHHYWLVVAARNADIDLARWDPNLGARANRDTFEQVYRNYLRLARRHPELWWAGMAGLAGSPFAAGFRDLGALAAKLPCHNAFRRRLDTVSVSGQALRWPRFVEVPSDIWLTITHGTRLSERDLSYYRERLMIMQKHIFTDIVSMHEAFILGGTTAIHEMRQARLIDDNAVRAWWGIASGRPAGFADALTRMADREQNQVIADQWDATAAGRGGMGRIMTYASTVFGRPIIPGVQAPGVFAPTTISAVLAGRILAVQMPLPNFNWADRTDRWKYIAGDLVPRHREMEQRPQHAAAVLSTPFEEILKRGRIVNRIPDLISDFTVRWKVTLSTREASENIP